MPRHSHSSKIGAKMATTRKEDQNGPPVICFITSIIMS